MRLLYSTLATQIAEYRLVQTIKYQECVAEALQGWDCVFITDIKSRVAPPKGYAVVYADLFTQGKFNYSRCRNASIKYAKEHGYDWLIQSNPDIVMLQPPQSFPASGLTSVMTHQSMRGEDVPALIREWRTRADLRFVGSSYFLMGADIFSKYRFCEDYYGYGYDDQDFMSNVLWPDRISRMDGTSFGARAIHVSYPGDLWGDIGPDLKRNKALFELRWKLTCAGIRP
jgi:hypothetical protein